MSPPFVFVALISLKTLRGLLRGGRLLRRFRPDCASRSQWPVAAVPCDDSRVALSRISWVPDGASAPFGGSPSGAPGCARERLAKRSSRVGTLASPLLSEPCLGFGTWHWHRAVYLEVRVSGLLRVLRGWYARVVLLSEPLSRWGCSRLHGADGASVCAGGQSFHLRRESRWGLEQCVALPLLSEAAICSAFFEACERFSRFHARSPRF